MVSLKGVGKNAGGRRICFNHHLLHCGSVEDLGLKENAWIVITYTRQKEALGTGRGPRNNDLQAGGVSEVGLGTLQASHYVSNISS